MNKKDQIGYVLLNPNVVLDKEDFPMLSLYYTAEELINAMIRLNEIHQLQITNRNLKFLARSLELDIVLGHFDFADKNKFKG